MSYRYLFRTGISWCVMALIAVMTSSVQIGGSHSVDYAYDNIYAAAPDFDVGNMVYIEKAIATPAGVISAPSRFDVAGINYISSNQPAQNWRRTVDAYWHIDPGRLLI
jgi:hypothetical protein